MVDFFNARQRLLRDIALRTAVINAAARAAALRQVI
jgi:hypothetical protein